MVFTIIDLINSKDMVTAPHISHTAVVILRLFHILASEECMEQNAISSAMTQVVCSMTQGFFGNIGLPPELAIPIGLLEANDALDQLREGKILGRGVSIP